MGGYQIKKDFVNSKMALKQLFYKYGAKFGVVVAESSSCSECYSFSGYYHISSDLILDEIVHKINKA